MLEEECWLNSRVRGLVVHSYATRPAICGGIVGCLLVTHEEIPVCIPDDSINR